MMSRAASALALLAIDPAGLGGLWLRARAGPLRDRVMAGLASPLPQRRLHPGIADDSLFGGLDLAATLASGNPVWMPGLLATPACLILTMAERCPAGLAARLAQALDTPRHTLVALDEGDDDESLPPALAERLALFIDLDGIAWSETDPIIVDPARLAAARAILPLVLTPPDAIATLTRAAARLGIGSLRAPLLALTAARAAAAWEGRRLIEDGDLRLAAMLVFGHRAKLQPDPAPPEDQPPPPPPDQGDPPDRDNLPDSLPEDLPEDLIVAAALAALPPELLAALNAGQAARAAKGASGTGGARAGNRRGRPLPSRPGRLGTGARIDIVATLRAAAPWQPLRRKTALSAATLHLLPGDIRLRRYVETSDRVLIFAVDASGSAAFARLAEVKGAVELLLAAAYARRDHVALLAFRGVAAELILPPTRSLVQTKRRLSGLPGGGGTPLAHGLQCAMATALQARARGLTPTIALLTDGRGNIALSGKAGRPQAARDAEDVARAIAAARLSAVVIDTGNRPTPDLAGLARHMAAPYAALPRADARRLSALLQQVIT